MGVTPFFIISLITKWLCSIKDAIPITGKWFRNITDAIPVTGK